MSKSKTLENLEHKPESVVVIAMTGSGENLSILLIKRKFPPFAGSLTFPGGFLRPLEASLDGAKRKLKKETGLALEPQMIVPLTVRENPWRDPRGEMLAFPYLFYFSSDALNAPLESDPGSLGTGWMKVTEALSLGFDHGAILCEALGLLFQGMPTYDDKLKIDLPALYGPKDNFKTGKIAFYGGTFNPWHQGHAICVDLFPEKNLVLVIDANPWKAEPKKDNCVFARFQKIALGYKDRSVAVFPGYAGKEKANPTVEWLPKVSVPDKSLLIGFDNFVLFEKWQDVKILAQSLTHLYVVPREIPNEHEDISQCEKRIKKMNSKISIIFLPHHLHEKLSSTLLRTQMKE